jgi:hypothetical protein
VRERLRIVVAGGIGAMPFAGVVWQVLQYLEGFRLLGHEVFYLEDTHRWPYDPVAESICDDASAAIEHLDTLMERFGLADAWAYVDVADESRVHGVPSDALDRVLSRADVLVNVSGVTVLRDAHLRIPARVYVETDPVLPQIEIAQGRQFTIDLLAAHTHHFTYGENFGAPDCEVPVERFDYRPTRPPVVLEWWNGSTAGPGSRNQQPSSRAFTTIANWHQAEKDVEWQGRVITWSKDVQFMRYLQLPERVRTPIELALAADGGEAGLAQLREHGWRIRPAGPLSKDIDEYRRYIGASAGEFSVAKEQYAALRSGWFSDRTACYLAAGKPAIVQDTGFRLPTGEGLLAFSTLDQAADAFRLIEADYPRHSAAARRIAEEHLRAETVLGSLLAEVTG